MCVSMDKPVTNISHNSIFQHVGGNAVEMAEKSCIKFRNDYLSDEQRKFRTIYGM